MRLALFDVDGTLVDARGAGRWALERAFERVYGLERKEGFSGGVRFDGATDPGIITEIAALIGVGPERLAGDRRRLEETYLGFLRERLSGEGASRPLPGVVSLLTALAVQGIPVGLVTGNIELGARLKLQAAGIARYFEAGAFGSDGGNRVALARLARERFEGRLGRSISPPQVVLFGDSTEDVRAARVNGYRSLAVATGVANRADLQAARPDRLEADLSGTGAILKWAGVAV